MDRDKEDAAEDVAESSTSAMSDSEKLSTALDSLQIDSKQGEQSVTDTATERTTEGDQQVNGAASDAQSTAEGNGDLDDSLPAPSDGQEFVTGVVKWFNVIRGYGFVTRDDGKPDVFVYQQSIKKYGYRTLGEGERVEMIVKLTDKGPEAISVTGPSGRDVVGSVRSRSRRKNNKCYNCGIIGHIAKECQEPLQPKKCHICFSEGHIKIDCPERANFLAMRGIPPNIWQWRRPFSQGDRLPWMQPNFRGRFPNQMFDQFATPFPPFNVPALQGIRNWSGPQQSLVLPHHLHAGAGGQNSSPLMAQTPATFAGNFSGHSTSASSTVLSPGSTGSSLLNTQGQGLAGPFPQPNPSYTSSNGHLLDHQPNAMTTSASQAAMLNFSEMLAAVGSQPLASFG